MDYAGDFHLDVVPRVTIKGKHYVCNRMDNKFEETDGNGYRDWFNEKNRITKGNLKRVVRLLKHLRVHLTASPLDSHGSSESTKYRESNSFTLAAAFDRGLLLTHISHMAKKSQSNS